MFLRFFLLFSLFFVFPQNTGAESVPQHTQARLFSAVKGLDLLKTVPVGVEIRLEQGWKTYWRTPGEAGLAPVFDWTGSDNFKLANIQWPAPHRVTAFDIDNFVYADTVVFPVDVTPENIGKPVSLQLKLDLLVCADICVPESHKLSLSIPAGAAKVSADQPALAAATAHVPLAANEESFAIQDLHLEEDDNKKVYLHVTAFSEKPWGDDTDLFVEHPSYISIGKPAFFYDAGTKKLKMEALIRSSDPLETLQKTLQSGQFILTIADATRSFERRVDVGGKKAEYLTQSILHITQEHIDIGILLLAFLGGLILNLMPCVLPVLSLKILSVLSHGGKDHRLHRKTIFRNFMASAAGIIFSFWLLAGSLIALKNAGQVIGWGIQFQHQGFLIFLIVVLTAFAANMWGLFEIPLPRFIARYVPAKHEQEPSFFGHFLTGAFATLLATPCTAPFLGTAVGFALAREATDILIIFTFLGLGLAAPYILLALSPRIFKYMPKPGRWMIALRKILALSLVITAGWLLSVLVTVSTQPTLDDGWTRFDEALIAPAITEGRTVVVDVTADWCLTCKANKRLVLDQKDVQEALSAPNVLRLQADWTHHDNTIAAYLKKYGRYGIPFNIIYGPGAPEGIILNELLNKKDMLRALTEAADE